MGHDDERPVRRPQLVHRLGDRLQGVDIEPRIGLVEDREARLEHGELQDLVALLLAAGEPLVHRPAQVTVVPADRLELRLEDLREVQRVELLETLMLADRVHRRAQEVGVGDAADRHRVLKSQERPGACPLFGLHRQQVVAVVADGAPRDRVGRMARQDLSERALAGAVRAHDGVYLAGVDAQRDPAQDFLPLGGSVEVGDLEQGTTQRTPPG